MSIPPQQVNPGDSQPPGAPKGVKIYDRPERAAISPVIWAVLVVVLIALIFFLYKYLRH